MEHHEKCTHCYERERMKGRLLCSLCAAQAEAIERRFGVSVNEVGNRPRGWWIVELIEDEEKAAGAKVGDLCVRTRDGTSNPIDVAAFKVGNCIGSVEDSFDNTFRHYYYRELVKEQPCVASSE